MGFALQSFCGASLGGQSVLQVPLLHSEHQVGWGLDGWCAGLLLDVLVCDQGTFSIPHSTQLIKAPEHLIEVKLQAAS